MYRDKFKKLLPLKMCRATLIIWLARCSGTSIVRIYILSKIYRNFVSRIWSQLKTYITLILKRWYSIKSIFKLYFKTILSSSSYFWRSDKISILRSAWKCTIRYLFQVSASLCDYNLGLVYSIFINDIIVHFNHTEVWKDGKRELWNIWTMKYL